MTYTLAITEDNWLPLSTLLMTQMGWKVGDFLTLEVVGDTILVRKEP